MSNKKIQRLPSILYIDANKATFYNSVVKSILQFTISMDAYKDMDIVNKEKLMTEISTFITTNKIVSGNLMIILSPSAIFEKDFTEPPSEKMDKEIQSFLDYVPFQNIASKIIKLPTRVRVVAANKDFCGEVFAAFTKQNFTTAGVVALSVVQEVIPEISKSIDLKVILTKFESLRQYSVFDTQQAILEAKKEESQKPFKSKRTIALMGTLALLLLILGIMVYTTFFQSTPKTATPSPVPVPPVVTEAPTPTTVASESAVLEGKGSSNSAH